MRRVPFTIVLTDNRGFRCIDRLQTGKGGAEFNNLYTSTRVEAKPEIDVVAHATSMWAHAVKAGNIAELEARLHEARGRDMPSVIVIESDPYPGNGAGGTWWDVPVPEVSSREEVSEARRVYEAERADRTMV